MFCLDPPGGVCVLCWYFLLHAALSGVSIQSMFHLFVRSEIPFSFQCVDFAFVLTFISLDNQVPESYRAPGYGREIFRTVPECPNLQSPMQGRQTASTIKGEPPQVRVCSRWNVHFQVRLLLRPSCPGAVPSRPSTLGSIGFM